MVPVQGFGFYNLITTSIWPVLMLTSRLSVLTSVDLIRPPLYHTSSRSIHAFAWERFSDPAGLFRLLAGDLVDQCRTDPH